MGDAFLQANRYQQFNDHLGKAEKQLMFQFNLKCSIPIWHRLRVISEDLHAGLALAGRQFGECALSWTQDEGSIPVVSSLHKASGMSHPELRTHRINQKVDARSLLWVQ